MKTKVLVLVSACLLVVAPAVAQDASDEGAAAESTGGESAEGEAAAAESTEGESAEGEAAEGEAAEAKAAEAKAADGEVSEGEAAASEGEAPAEAGEPGQPPEEKVGPGGRALRTDYPGTDEALRERMDTDRIEGLEIDPDQPQEAYTMRVKELETKIDDLKEKVFQSKTRIVLLRETLLSGNLAGARASIVHRSDLGAAYKLRRATYSLDGTKVYGQVDNDGSLSEKNVFEVYNGGISPGNHTLSVSLQYQGSGYGLFTYFEGYEFPIKSSCQFEAKEGKVVQVRATPYEAGDATTSKEDRPNFKCEVKYFDSTQDDVAPDESDESDAAAGDGEV